MTLLFMEGFEAVVDNPDLTARGWTTSTATGTNGNGVLTVPSRTGMAGRGLMLRGPYNAGNGLPMQSVGATDFGIYNTGKSVYSAWQAGGFAAGFNATFNKASQLQVASYNVDQLVYDGSVYYWAIVENAASLFLVAYSPDLINWTLTQTAAPCNQASTISVIGSGATATVMIGHVSSQDLRFYYTTNLGLTWTGTNNPGGAVAAYAFRPLLTGNNATPIVAMGVSSTSPYPTDIFYYPSLGGAAVRVGTLTLGNTSTNLYAFGTAKIVSGIACFTGVNTGAALTTGLSAVVSYWICCPVAADMTNPANYTSSQALPSQEEADITFFNNQWISVGYNGINVAANSGTVGTPAGPTGPWINALTFASGMPIWSVDNNGTICVAVGEDSATPYMPAIWTSTNGTTWTKVDKFIWSSSNVVNSMTFTNVIWDGARFIITGGQNDNVIATSTDGLAWTAVYYPDYTEAAGTASASLLGVYSGTTPAGSYTVAPSSTLTAVGVAAGALTGGNRNVYLTTVTPAGSVAIGSANVVPVTPLSHYYEIIATATATVNQFTVQLAIDGVVVPNSVVALMAASTDTTGIAQLLINLPHSGNFTVIDDIYLTNFAADAAGNVGQLGVVNIIPHMPTTDVQTQMTQVGTAASHAAQVAGALSLSEGSVATNTQGAKDIYSSTNTIPANYRVQAIQAEAFFTKYGPIGANANMGIVSGSTEVDSATVSALTNTPVYASILQALDPATGLPWTAIAAQAAKLSVTKVT